MMSDTATEEKTVLSEKVQKIIDAISELKALELSELKKGIEETFDVTAASGGGVMMAAPAGGGDDAGEDAGPTSYDIILKEVGDKKIQVIKAIREITGQGLKEAKEIADSAPKAVKEGVEKGEAEEIQKKLEAAGGVVELKGK
jgi:large subunit ribosomal protein L7/L12